MLHHATGDYNELPGWSEDITGGADDADLPADARDYLRFIEERRRRARSSCVGVGPGREQIIWTDGVRDGVDGLIAAAA